MNSRLEGGHAAWNTKEELLEEIHRCLDDGEIEAIYEENGDYVAYEIDDGLMVSERRIYFPEAETPWSVCARMCFDEAVLEYIRPEGVADFICNCIDVNAVAAVRAVALLYNEALVGEDGEIEGYEPCAARQTLEEMVAGGCDSYAYEVGFEDGEPALGITWVERSAVIVNVDAVVSSARVVAADLDREWEFDGIFREAFVQTLCHEFRHAVYELNEFIEVGDNPAYPADGGLEDAVEAYGNAEAERLMCDGAAMGYVAGMFR